MIFCCLEEEEEIEGAEGLHCSLSACLPFVVVQGFASGFVRLLGMRIFCLLFVVALLGNGLRDKVSAQGWLDTRQDFLDTLFSFPVTT